MDGSESKGIVYFNAIDQSYRLTVQDPDENPIDGFLPKGKVYSIGELNSLSEVAGESLKGSVVQYRGSYYALTDSDPELRNNKSVYYQRGSRKGKLKMAKEWRDVLPILSVINRWKGFETVRTNYYE